jgi:hypothetical protein
MGHEIPEFSEGRIAFLGIRGREEYRREKEG